MLIPRAMLRKVLACGGRKLQLRRGHAQAPAAPPAPPAAEARATLSKGERLKLLSAALLAGPRASSPAEAREIIHAALTRIEDEYVLDGSEKMTIPLITAGSARPYGQGGVYLPLLSGEVHFGADGSFGLAERRSPAPALGGS